MDRKEILLCVISVYFLIGSSGCKEEAVTADPTGTAEYTQIDFEPSLTGDSQNLLYVHSDVDYELSGIYLHDFSNNKDSMIIPGLAQCPEWSPDKKWIVYSINTLLIKSKSNGDSQTVIANTGLNFFPHWSPDGSKIAYSETSCGNSETCGIYVMNPDGENKTLIESKANFPAWKDSGNVLIYLKPLTENYGIRYGDSLIEYNLHDKFRKGVALFNGDENKINSYLSYSRNEVFFSSVSKTGYSYIYKYSIDDKTLIRLTSSQGISPETTFYSDKIIYTNRNPGNGRLWIMNKDGSNAAQLIY